MRLSHQKLAPALFAVFYGALVVLGQALHYLPGMNHFSDSSSQACCCALHSCDQPLPDGQTEGSDKDCPICELLALAQDRVIHSPGILPGEHIVEVALEAPLPTSPQPFDLYSARGPPARLLAGV